MLKKDSYLQPRFLIALLSIFLSIVSTNNCYAKVAVGDSYVGGTVFCVSQTSDTSKCVTTGSGDYGLIMANEDQANYDSNSKHGVTWASAYKITNAQSDDNGIANTSAITTAYPNDNSDNNAAWLCRNYDKEKGRVGFTDWYLPSKNELNKIYLYARANNLIGRKCTGKKDGGIQCLLGNNDNYIVYWSSTEYSGDNDNGAWEQGFGDRCPGSQGSDSEISAHSGARAIRTFNNSTIQQFIDEMRTALYNVLDTMPMDLINIITGYTIGEFNGKMLSKKVLPQETSFFQ